MKNDIKRAFLVRAPAALQMRLQQVAEAQGISANSVCVNLITRGLRAEATPYDQIDAPLTSRMTGPIEGNEAGAENGGTSLESELLTICQREIIPVLGMSLLGIVLYGSAARGALHANSDIDLLLVLRSEVALDRDMYNLFPSLKIHSREISPFLVRMPYGSDDVRSVWLEAATDGIVLFDRGFQISRFLSQVRTRIAEGKVQRRYCYGVPYWAHQEEVDSEGHRS